VNTTRTTRLFWLTAGVAATGLFACAKSPQNPPPANEASNETTQQGYSSEPQYGQLNGTWGATNRQAPEEQSNDMSGNAYDETHSTDQSRNSPGQYGTNSGQYGNNPGQDRTNSGQDGNNPEPYGPNPYGAASSSSNGNGQNGTMESSASSSSNQNANTPSNAQLSQLNDAQIAAVLEALNDGEIRIAEMAEATTSKPEVRRLAHELSVDHQAMLSKEKGLWSRLHITPQANPVSGQLDSDTQTDVTKLTAAQGDQFDREYVDMQVRAHHQAIDLIDRLLPYVKNNEIRSDLEAARPKLEMHLRMAQQVSDSMKKGVTERQPGQ
jgi:putative membrane protein